MMSLTDYKAASMQYIASKMQANMSAINASAAVLNYQNALQGSCKPFAFIVVGWFPMHLRKRHRVPVLTVINFLMNDVQNYARPVC